MGKLDFRFDVQGVKLGFILVKGIDVKTEYVPVHETDAIFKEVKSRHTLETLGTDRIIQSFRRLYSSHGIDPTKDRISSEALIRRMIKGENVWKINNVVDTLNLVSARSMLPMGYIDFKKVEGAISVRTARENEEFVKIGGKPMNCKGGEICVSDETKIIDYGYATSDSDLTKVTFHTKDMLVLFYASAEVTDKQIEDAMNDAKDYLKKVTHYEILEEGIAKGTPLKASPVGDAKKPTIGLSVKKDEEFSEWYTQVIQKADLADYTPVSGCIVFKPNSYAIWEALQRFLDGKFKASGVKNAYFPLFIPESLLTREKEHVEGFTPEVAWVTHAGNTPLSERLAVRPTSETIMYDSYSKWIRSHNDLPLRLNQWCSVVRWEFKHAIPFLRTREFLWQEGHSVFATQKEADSEAREILEYYAQAFEECLAVPVIRGTKTATEKFAGALYSLAVETFLPIGKAIQAATSHSLGQNFSKAFNISFQDKKGGSSFGWQNSWGFSTRSIGIMIITHGDDKGLVLPPRIAPVQAVIVPILFDESKKAVLKKAKQIRRSLSKKSRIQLDDRENYSPGWKFNDWEMKGVPIRIELGPKDLASDQVMVVRRDTGVKEAIRITELKSRVPAMLEDIQAHLFMKAKKRVEDAIADVHTWEEFKKAEAQKRWIRASHCGEIECEKRIKDETEGVKTNCIPLDQPEHLGKCVKCGKDAKYKVLLAKSY